MDKPDFPMYAIVYNQIVIDCGFGDEVIQSPLTKKTYIKNNNYQFVAMTTENSPAGVGMRYDGNKFYFEGEN